MYEFKDGYFGYRSNFFDEFKFESKDAEKILAIATGNSKKDVFGNEFEFGQAKAYFKNGGRLTYSYYTKERECLFGLPLKKEFRYKLRLEKLVKKGTEEHVEQIYKKII